MHITYLYQHTSTYMSHCCIQTQLLLNMQINHSVNEHSSLTDSLAKNEYLPTYLRLIFVGFKSQKALAPQINPRTGWTVGISKIVSEV